MNKKTIKIFTLITLGFCVLGCGKETTEFKIKLDSKDGTKIEDGIINENNKIEVPEDPEKDGYIFVEWTQDGKPYDFDSEVTGDINLEAKWEKASDKLIDNAKKSLKSIYYITSKKDLNIVYTGCEFELLEKDNYKKLTRGIESKEISLNYNLTCGTDSEKVSVKGIIKESPYRYTAVSNENKQNYDMTIISNDRLNGNIYDMNGSYLSDLINSKAIINNADIENSKKFLMLLNDDESTIYVVSQK